MVILKRMIVQRKLSFFLSSLLLFEVDSRDGRTDRREGLDSMDCWMDVHRQADKHSDWYMELAGTFILTTTRIDLFQ
jgi:hypothetical protein